jgi:hypothetical protein
MQLEKDNAGDGQFSSYQNNPLMNKFEASLRKKYQVFE